MQDNNTNNYLQKDEIDLKDTLNLLINSKKLIIAITLIITTLGAIYAFQKAPVYHSTALLEIGSYSQDEQILIETANNLIQELKINFIYTLGNDLSINSFENRLINIAHTSTSSVTSKNLLNKITRYIENRHSLLLSNYTQKTKNQLTYKIKQLNDQIEYSNNISLTKNLDEKLRISNLIEYLNIQLPYLDRKIEILKEIIIADTRNLLLLETTPELLIQRAALTPTLDQVIFSYRSDIIDYENVKIKLSQEKDNLESQLKLLESNNLESETSFKLLLEKDSLELELEFLKKQNLPSTQLIGEIVTTPIDSRIELIIFSSFIFSLFLSIIVVFINNFVKTFKEELA